MKLTIIREDKTAYKDGMVYDELDVSSMPTNIHALQWNNDKGWIEYSEDFDGNREPNTKISILPEWANTIIDFCVVRPLKPIANTSL